MIAPHSVEVIALDFQRNDNGVAAKPGIYFPLRLKNGEAHPEAASCPSTSSSWPLSDGFYVVKTDRLIRPAQTGAKDSGIDEMFVKGAVEELLKALDFLHSEAHVVHTDIHPGNLLLGINGDSLLRLLEGQEFSSPVARKVVSPSRTIYLSRLMRPKPGPMLLADFGEARSGPGPHTGDIMPIQYRAPETIMCISWSYPVDLWSVGLAAWDVLGPKRLFTAQDEDGYMYDAARLAQLIAALGPPPLEFLRRNPERAADFWNENGVWLGLAPIPPGRTLEELETQLKDPSRFIALLQRILTWVPEERPTAKELLQDLWLRE